MEVTVAEALVRCLQREQVDTIFGIPGGYFIPLLDAFRRAGIRSIEARHEGAAAFMAAGWAQATGKVGVVHTQSGPGTTNAVTGIAANYMDSVPTLLLASQIQRSDWCRGGHQESTGLGRCVDQVDLFRSISHFSGRPALPDTAVTMMRAALRAAITRRGPAVLEVATDLLSEQVAFEDLAPSQYRCESTTVDRTAVDRLVELLKRSRLPVLVVGDQLAHRGLGPTLRALCEEQQIACATVNYAKGMLPEDHALSVGVIGQAGHGSAAEILRHADLVITLGVRLNQATTLAFNRTLFHDLVQVDSDPQQIGTALPISLGVLGDVPSTVTALREALRGTRPDRDLTGIVKELRHKHSTYDDSETHVDSTPVAPPRLFKVLRECLPRETAVIADTGTTQVALAQHFQVFVPDSYFALYALAPMGSGLPIANGVQLARPDAVVLNVIGDGGFLAHAGELSVAVQHELPTLTIVVNNGSYKSIADRQAHWYKHEYGVKITNPDYAALSRSFGADGYLVRSSEELKAAVGTALARRRPTVIEVQVDAAHHNRVPEEIRTYFNGIFAPARDGWPFPS